MRIDSPWSDLSVVDFCGGLASGSTGAGSVPAAVLLVATGAALAAAVQRGNTSSPGAVYALGRADELDALRERALQRMEMEREVCGKLNRDLEQDELQKWRQRSVELALEASELAVAALRISIVGVLELAPQALGDARVAAGILKAAADCVEPEVRRRIAGVNDIAWSKRHQLAAEVLIEEASSLLIEIQSEASPS